MNLAIDVEPPVKVYVGATEEQLVPYRVLEYSIGKHTTTPVQVRALHQSGIEIPSPRLPALRGYTTFSFQRFTIPELQNFSGRAIYLDSDMIVFQDIRRLWELPFDGAQVLAVPRPEGVGRFAQFSVLLLDCGSLSWNVKDIVAGLDRKEYTYGELMAELPVAERVGTTIPASWNSCERYEEETTALLHFTRVETQPWLSVLNPLGHFWCRLLLEALDEARVSMDLIQEHVRRGFLRPSLLWQIEHRVDDSRRIPRSVVSEMDAKFSIPYVRKASVLRRAAWFATDQWNKLRGPSSR
jgi:hypothetical protein